MPKILKHQSIYRFTGLLLAVLFLNACQPKGNSEKNSGPPARGGFDSELWKSPAGHSEDTDNPRAGLVIELMDGLLPMGTPRAEVLEMLGPPDFESGTGEFYVLGRSPYGIDLEYFVVEYEGDQLKTASIQRG